MHWLNADLSLLSRTALQVNPENGIVYNVAVQGDIPSTANRPHWIGTHSAPWYLYQVGLVAAHTAVR